MPASPKPSQPWPLRQSRSQSPPARHLLLRSSPLTRAHLCGAKGSIAIEKEITTVTPSDSPPNGPGDGRTEKEEEERDGEGWGGGRGAPCYRKALIQIIKTLSCYEQAGGGAAGWVGCGGRRGREAAGGHGRGAGGGVEGEGGSTGRRAKRKEKSFNLAFPHPQPQIHSSCQMQSPLALTLTHY